ncbi:MAG: hypothetical protein GY932_14615, partial [Arcobacter sp.]|nr:hypothetical protein [Arcobacter sp.]
MKKYNVKNYIRYKDDVKISIKNVNTKRFIDYTSKELKIIFLPLVENIGRKFATSQEASGVMSIMDIIQEGSLQLCKAVDKIDRQKLIESEDIEKTLKSFLAKRIRGGIRREIDRNRGTMRIPEHKINEMRKGKDEKMVRMFFNSIFLSIDAKPDQDENMAYQIPDKSDPYNEVLLNAYLMSLLEKHLTSNEVFVLSKSYGLDGPK